MKINLKLLLQTVIFFAIHNLYIITTQGVEAAHSDQYLTGYIQSIFTHSYGFPADAVIVKGGIVVIDEEKLGAANPEQILYKIQRIAASISGVKQTTLKKKDASTQKSTNWHTESYQTAKEEVVDGTLPSRSLFEPLIADPRWPRFSLAYQYYSKNKVLHHAFAPNFGASFPLYRITNHAINDEWEIGVQAGLFALMDIGRNPTALINADYFVGVPITYRSGSWSGLMRGYHVSSHLGDEFMLTNEGKKTKRINLSYEGIDLILSYNFENFRLYGGGGYLVHKEPNYVKPGKIQGGAEYYSPNTWLGGRLRPIIGLDLKAEENVSWYTGVSLKAGVQLENSKLLSNKIQLMLEMFNGKSIHGQFFKDKVQYIGIGIHAFL